MKKPKIRCPSCGSSQAYLRLRTGQIVCPECGEITQVKKPLTFIKLPDVTQK